jgi:2-methylcitrate dehydratase PrpD
MEPGVAKQMATGHSAQAGLVAADLAAAGAAGPASILEGEHGWLQATGSLADGLVDPVSAQRHLQAEPAAPWLLQSVSFKPWPACRHVHPAIGCALKAHALGLAPQQVLRLSLATYAVALTFADQPAPTTPYGARFSLQHAVAWALCYGDFWLEASAPAGWADPACAALRARVQLSCASEHEQRYPQRFSASLTVHMQDGSTHVCEEDSAWGDPEQPMSIADLQAKAHRMLVDVGVRDHDARALIAHCLALPGSGDLAPWWARLQALPQAQDVFIG